MAEYLDIDYPPWLMVLNDDVLFLICQELIAVPPRGGSSTSSLLPYDALSASKHVTRSGESTLSAIKAFSMTCKRHRFFALPMIFHDVKIPMGFHKLPEALYVMERNRLARHAIRKVTIDFTYFDKQLEESDYLGRRLARFVRSLGRLETFSVDLLWMTFSEAKLAFFDEIGMLPQVRRLSVCREMSPLIAICPNAVAVQGILLPNCDLIRGLQNLHGLRRLELKTQWNFDMLQKLHETVPNLEELGTLDALLDTGLLPLLNRFSNLRILAADRVEAPLPWRISEHFSTESCIEVLNQCLNLEVLWIRDQKVTVQRAGPFGMVDDVIVEEERRRPVVEEI